LKLVNACKFDCKKTLKTLSKIPLSGYHCTIKYVGEVTNAKNIKADTPKILRPTHFSGTKDIKANIFLALINIKANLLKVNNNTEKG
jgi:hypothetical protein